MGRVVVGQEERTTGPEKESDRLRAIQGHEIEEAGEPPSAPFGPGDHPASTDDCIEF